MVALVAHKPTPHVTSSGWLGGSGGVPGVPIVPLLTRSADHRDPRSRSLCNRSLPPGAHLERLPVRAVFPTWLPTPPREIGHRRGRPQQSPEGSAQSPLFDHFPVLGGRPGRWTGPSFPS